jgi:ribonucleoside-diphosphate reductase alpha chain
MQIKKRDGSLESVDFNKILKSITRFSEKITDIDPVKVAQKIVNGIYDGISTHQIDHLAVQTSASLIADEPNYSYLAARLLCKCIEKESNSASSGIYSFSQSMQIAYELGLINERLSQFVKKNSRKLNDAIKSERNDLFEYFGLKTLYDRYLLKHPKTRLVIETPQYLFMRVACAISENIKEAIEYYQIFSLFEYIPSTPTLFNAGTKHEQLSSCYLLDSPMDSLESIYDRYKQMALLSKYSGGLGLSYHRVRSFGSLIKGTNGASNGIIPWLKTLDSSVSAVNQGGRRKGACCVYLETWHADIESFLELRDNTGDEARRTHNLNLSHWIPDLFMKRVEEDADWSLFDPALVPEFTDLFGEDFEKAYLEAEKSSKFVKQVKARDLYGKMMRSFVQNVAQIKTHAPQ